MVLKLSVDLRHFKDTIFDQFPFFSQIIKQNLSSK